MNYLILVDTLLCREKLFENVDKFSVVSILIPISATHSVAIKYSNFMAVSVQNNSLNRKLFDIYPSPTQPLNCTPPINEQFHLNSLQSALADKKLKVYAKNVPPAQRSMKLII